MGLSTSFGSLSPWLSPLAVALALPPGSRLWLSQQQRCLILLAPLAMPRPRPKSKGAEPFPAEPPQRLLELARHYLRTIGFNAHQLGSFNAFCTRTVNEIVEGFDPIVCTDNVFQTCSDVPPACELSIQVAVRDVVVHPTELEPAECMSRLMDYTAPLFGTIRIRMTCNEVLIWEQEYKGFALGRIPVMVLSKFCKLGALLESLPGPAHRAEREQVLARHRMDMSEVGGYFIVHGAEKVVVGQERLNNSSVYVFPSDDKESGGSLGIRTDVPVIAECRSHSTKKNKQEMFSLTFSPVANRPSHVIRVTLPKFKKDFPLFIMLRAMLPIVDEGGLSATHTIFHRREDLARLLLLFSPKADDPAVFDAFVKVLEGSWGEAYGSWTPKDCLYYIGQRCSLPEERGERAIVRSLNIQQTILKEIFPHVYDGPGLAPAGLAAAAAHLRTPVPPKLLYVLHMVYRLLSVVLGWECSDDRDHYAIKRIDTCGTLMRSLYRQVMVKQVKELQKQVVLSCKKVLRTGGKKYTFDDLVATLKALLCERTFGLWWMPMSVQKEFGYALKTGNWNKVRTHPPPAPLRLPARRPLTDAPCAAAEHVCFCDSLLRGHESRLAALQAQQLHLADLGAAAHQPARVHELDQHAPAPGARQPVVRALCS